MHTGTCDELTSILLSLGPSAKMESTARVKSQLEIGKSRGEVISC